MSEFQCDKPSFSTGGGGVSDVEMFFVDEDCNPSFGLVVVCGDDVMRVEKRFESFHCFFLVMPGFYQAYNFGFLSFGERYDGCDFV